MQGNENPAPAAPKRVPWNEGKLVRAKPPLRPKPVWSIRTKLQIAGRVRDLAMFNLAIDEQTRRTLPDHLPRERVEHEAACTCPTWSTKSVAAAPWVGQMANLREPLATATDPPSGR